MTPEDFAKEFKLLKELLLSGYFDSNSEISKIGALKDAGLDKKQIDIVQSSVDGALTDALYTVLLGLDGCSSIGEKQESYLIKDESGNAITGSGELEAAAWEQFHG